MAGTSKFSSGDKATGVLVAFLLFGALYLGIKDAQDSTVPTGKPAPEFQVETPTKGMLTLRELKGQVVMIDFWATWCPPCVEEMPWLVKLAQEYEGKGVRFVAVNQDDPDQAFAAVDEFISTRVPGLKPYLAFGNDQTSTNYGVSFLPTLYVIGKDGSVSASASGSVSEARVRKWLDDAVAAGPAAAP